MAVMNPVTGNYELDDARGIRISLSGLNLDLSMWGNVILPGGATAAGATIITSSSAAALAVGRQGATSPVLAVDASAALVVTGLLVKGQASGSGVNLSVQGGGAAEDLFIDAKGTGALKLASVSTGVLQAGNVTNPAFKVTLATAGTGVNITSAAAAGGVAIAAISSGGAENIKLDAKGTGQIIIGATSTGFVSIGRGSAAGLIQSSALATFAGTNQTLTAAQLQGGYIEGSPTGGATYTFDSGANLDTAFPNAVAGDSFDCVIAVMTAQVVTWGAGAGNAIRSKAATFTGTATGACVLASIRKTGGGAWTIYLTAAV